MNKIYLKYQSIDKIFGIKKDVFIGWSIFLVVFCIIHFIAEPTFVDDAKFRAIAQKENYDLLTIVFGRYFENTSRLWVDFQSFLFVSLPPIIWKIVDVAILACCYKVLAILSNYYIGMALLLCAYPFQHMASAGWIASTTNYLWPFVAALCAFYMLYKNNAGKKFLYTILYFVLLIYACNSEIMACLYLVAMCVYLYCVKKKEKIITKNKLTMIIISIGITIIGISNALLCPGNGNRIDMAIAEHMPEYPQLNIFDKLRICVVSTIEHFTSLPNIIFMLFGFLILIIVFYNSKKLLNRIVACIPLIISTILSAYYFYNNILINRNFHYVYTDILLKNQKDKLFNYGLLILSIIYIVAVIWSLIIIFKDNVERVEMVAIYLGGLAARFMLIVSPTMLASGPRMYFVFYISMAWISCNLIKKIKKPLLRYVCYAFLLIGIIINIAMVFITQRHQG